MADDIDIEEHDIMEHPRFKDYLPDCNIKEEPVDQDYQEFEVPIEDQNYDEYDYYEPPDYDPELEERSYQEYGEISIESYAVPVSPPQNDFHNSNKIILGSKPCSTTPVFMGTSQSPMILTAQTSARKSTRTPIISNVQGSQMFETNSSNSTADVIEIPTTSEGFMTANLGPIVIGSKPCPKSRKLINEAGTSSTPDTNGSLSSQEHVDLNAETPKFTPSLSRPCPKSRKADLQVVYPTILEMLLTESSEGEETDPKPVRIPENATVLLEDWGARLETNPCYCSHCQTLFATRNALDAHNMVAHSFLVALDDPVSPGIQSPPSMEEKPEKYCNQCHTYFSDDNLLIQHLYEHLTANDNKRFYKCPICFSYYVSLLRFNKHTTRSHSVTLSGIVPVTFMTVCDICHKETTVLSHNKHIQNSHKHIYEKKMNKTGNTVSKVIKTHPKKIVSTVKSTGIINHASKNSKIALKLVPHLKCGKCKTLYSTKKSLLTHFSRCHPKERTFYHTVKKVEVPSNKQNENHLTNNIPVTSRHNVGNFKCVKCKKYYYTKKSLSAHINSKHPFEKAFIQLNKPGVPQKTQSIPQKTQSLLKKSQFLSQKIKSLPLNTNQRSANTVNNLKTCVKLKCGTCIPSRLYSTRKTVLTHIRLKHPNEKRFYEVTVKANSLIKPPKKSIFPANALFKCRKCNIHFMSVFAADVHLSRGCTQFSSKVNWTCRICKNTFRSKDKALHLQQHELSVIIKIHSFSEKLYHKVLYKCVDCNVHFEERQFLKHRSVGCRASASVWCYICKLSVFSADHQSHHSSAKARSDFIYLYKFFSPGNKNASKDADKGITDIPTNDTASKFTKSSSLKRKLPPPELLSKIPKMTDKTVFYYCTLCHIFSKTLACRNFHVSKRCAALNLLHWSCPSCGLNIRAGTPMKYHKMDHRQNNMKFGDYVFYNMQDVTPVVPSIPQFRSCKTCNVQFISQTHSCNDARKVCNICDKSFDVLAFKLHKIHHKYLKPSTELADVTELIQKYESLKSTWNIIYQCSECDLVTDSYDRAVEHSQRHLASSANQRNAKTCEICRLNFDDSSIKKHKELHSNEDIDRSSFVVLKYKHEDLLTDDWFNLFSNLSAGEIEQITSPSIYVTRKLKMNLILNGSPEFTIYKCESCKNYVDDQSVFEHSKVCTGSGVRHPCAICDIPFISQDALKKHQVIHKTSDVTTNSYRIVSFNADADKEFNNILSKDKTLDRSTERTRHYQVAMFLQCSTCKSCSSSADFYKQHSCRDDISRWSCNKCDFVSRYKPSHVKWHEINSDVTAKDIVFVQFDRTNDAADSPYRIPRNKTHVRFQCPRCEILLPSFDTQHSCGDMDIETCTLCDYKFSTRSFKYHILLHEKTPDLTRDTIHIIPLKHPIDKVEQDKSVDRVPTVFKCDCGLHFTSERTMKKHSRVCAPDLNVSSENCGQCGLLFPTELLVSHLCNQHRIGSSGKCNIVSPPTNLYRCSACYCAFTKMVEFSAHHRDNLCNVSYAVKCEKCDMAFHERVIDEHKSSHDSDFERLRHNIVTLGKYNPETIYKCNSCSTHFLAKNNLQNHLRVCNNLTKKSSCKDCGLTFFRKALIKHTKLHHKKLILTARDFNIVSFDPVHAKSAVEKEDSIDLHNKLMNYTHNNIDYDVILHKCWCDACFSSKQEYLEHTGSDHSESKEWCPECGFVFTADCLKTHNEVHHNIMHLKTEDFVVITKDDEKFTLTRKRKVVSGVPTENNCIYKCKVCRLNFLSMESAMLHITTCFETKVNGIKCKKCHLNFTARGLIKHTIMHHNDFKFELEDMHVYIVEKYSEGGNEVNVTQCYDDSISTVSEGTIDVTTVNDASLDLNTTVESGCSTSKVTLYKCVKCGLHFLSYTTTMNHISNHKTLPRRECEDCGLSFTYNSHRQHQILHHGEDNNTNFTIYDVGDGNSMTGNVLYKCKVCILHFVCFNSLISHISVGNHVKENNNPNKCSECPKCGIVFSNPSLKKHMDVHHEKRSMCRSDFVIKASDGTVLSKKPTNKDRTISEDSESPVRTPTANKKSLENSRNRLGNRNATCDRNNDAESQPDESVIDDSDVSEFNLNDTDNKIDISELETNKSDVLVDSLKVKRDFDDSIVTQSSSDDHETNKTVKKEEYVVLYKCGQCNVFFMTEATCRKHIMYHNPIDSREYIECKICSLQFKIMSLALHMRKHHKDEFELSKVLVEEYHPVKKGEKKPKIDIYHAIDKVQSRLVSTTTDDEKVDIKMEEATQSHVDRPTETSPCVDVKLSSDDTANVPDIANSGLKIVEEVDESSENITPVTLNDIDDSNSIEKDANVTTSSGELLGDMSENNTILDNLNNDMNNLFCNTNEHGNTNLNEESNDVNITLVTNELIKDGLVNKETDKINISNSVCENPDEIIKGDSKE